MPTKFKAALVHVIGSGITGVLVFSLVFFLWFPSPFDQLTGGRSLFKMVLAVDLICGPLLTFVVFNPKKNRSELIRDMLVVIGLQLGALLYGLWSAFLARPVYIGFEGDRFRVVTAIEIEDNEGGLVQNLSSRLPLNGPHYVGVKLLTPADPSYLQSIQKAIEGIHPSMQPSRLLLYSEVAANVAENAKPFSDLETKAKAQGASYALRSALSGISTPESKIGYFPLISKWRSDWVVLVDRQSGSALGLVSVDGW